MVLKNRSALRRTVSKSETKICPLCSSLNFYSNRDCFFCGWHGKFEDNSAAIDFHWQELIDRHEEVRLEHLTAHFNRELDDYGHAKQASAWCKIKSLFASLKQALTVRTLVKDTASQPNTAMPPK